MLREAELFAFAEELLIEILGRIRHKERDILLPPLSDLPGPSEETPLWSVVEQYAHDDACVPGVLGGDTACAPDRQELRRDLDGARLQGMRPQSRSF